VRCQVADTPLRVSPRQVQIGAALFTGLLFGAFKLDTNAQTQLDFEVNKNLVEMGNNLVLFFAGLSCEADMFFEYFRAVNILGLGYFVLASALFALIGWGTGLCVGMASVCYFGIACSLSSRQLMKEHLDRVLQQKTMHGRLLQV
jgi:Kef-type K+ transport system membrane component KefB